MCCTDDTPSTEKHSCFFLCGWWPSNCTSAVPAYELMQKDIRHVCQVFTQYHTRTSIKWANEQSSNIEKIENNKALTLNSDNNKNVSTDP